MQSLSHVQLCSAEGRLHCFRCSPTVRPLAITPQTRTTNSSYTREETGDPRAKEPGEVHDCEDPEPESDPERAQPHKENLRAHFKVIQTAPTWVEGCPHPT